MELVHVHQFFQRIRQNSEGVNKFAYTDEIRFYSFHKFSTVFEIFFPKKDFGGNLKSWLDVISTSFDVVPEGEVTKTVIKDCKEFWRRKEINLNPDSTENIPCFKFWLYLIQKYRLLGKEYITRTENYNKSITNENSKKLDQLKRNDMIYQFMNGCKFEETKVVLIGQDPAPGVASSGYAFHGSVCDSTNVVFDKLAYEMNLLYHIGNSLSSLLLSRTKLTDAKKSGTMSGWISQNVLLINARLKLLDEHAPPSPLIKFLVRRLSQSRDHLVFILAGNVAQRLRAEIVMKKNNHLIIEVDHPAHYTYEGGPRSYSPWSGMLPFVNANFFLYQRKPKASLIDWVSMVKDHDAVVIDRLQRLTSFFDGILSQHGDLTKTDKSQYYVLATVDGRLQVRKKPLKRR